MKESIFLKIIYRISVGTREFCGKIWMDDFVQLEEQLWYHILVGSTVLMTLSRYPLLKEQIN